MGLFTKGIEYNKLAMAFNGMFLIVNEIDNKAKSRISEAEFDKIPDELIMLAYLCRINIVNRMEKYDWGLMTPIKIPNISSSRITLMQAYNMTVDKVSILAMDLEMTDVIQSVLEKGEHFYKFEKSLPVHVKIKLNEGM